MSRADPPDAPMLPDIPEANRTIAQPVLYFACTKDYVCVPALSMGMKEHCKNLTVKELDAGHWGQLEASDKFNADLLEWINGVVGKA